MPSLTWIGKSAVVEYHKQVPFRLIKCREDLSVGDPESGNLLVQGDNLEALKALLPYYAGQVKCIYIDPPYYWQEFQKEEDISAACALGREESEKNKDEVFAMFGGYGYQNPGPTTDTICPFIPPSNN